VVRAGMVAARSRSTDFASVGTLASLVSREIYARVFVWTGRHHRRTLVLSFGRSAQ
jgi:hypothetical protein